MGNTAKKAGALNQALAAVLPDLDGDDLVLIQDADSALDQGFVAAASSTSTVTTSSEPSAARSAAARTGPSSVTSNATSTPATPGTSAGSTGSASSSPGPQRSCGCGRSAPCRRLGSTAGSPQATVTAVCTTRRC